MKICSHPTVMTRLTLVGDKAMQLSDDQVVFTQRKQRKGHVRVREQELVEAASKEAMVTKHDVKNKQTMFRHVREHCNKCSIVASTYVHLPEHGCNSHSDESGTSCNKNARGFATSTLSSRTLARRIFIRRIISRAVVHSLAGIVDCRRIVWR